MAKRGFRKSNKNLGLVITETNPMTGESKEVGYKLDELSIEEIQRVFLASHGIKLSNSQAKKLKAGKTVNLRVRDEGHYETEKKGK